MREPVVMTLGRGRWRAAYEATMIALALLVVATLPFDHRGWVRAVDLAVWAIFVADYVTRLVLSTDRRAFVRANVVDLLAILPADLFRAFRILRLARLLRLLRAIAILRRILGDVQGVAATNGLTWVLGVAAATVLAGATAVWVIEPTIGRFGDALWWSIVTATTVGYGDLSPEHPLARVLAVLLMLVWIGTIGMVTGSIATYFLGGDSNADPDVEHVRERLRDWNDLSAAERRRVVRLLEAMVDN